MNKWKIFILGIFLVALCACAAQQGSKKTSPDGSVTTPGVGTSATSLTEAKTAPSIKVPALPCAEVVKTEGVEIRYEAERLYHGGSVLPSEEGLVCLEVLADWLKDAPQSRWLVTSAGEADFGFDPQALAGKRQSLLLRFFSRRGIQAQTLEWLTVAGQGPQLKLRLVAN